MVGIVPVPPGTPGSGPWSVPSYGTLDSPMKRDLDAAISFLFPNKIEEVRTHLGPLPNNRVRWAVLAWSRGDEKELEQHLKYALADWRDVLQSESMSDDPKGPGLRALPRPEELAFQLHARDLERLAFFDRM